MLNKKTLRGIRPLPVVISAIALTSGFAIASGLTSSGWRTIDGWNNNPLYPDMNATHTPLMREMYPAYDDGVAQMSGSSRPNPRYISNAVNDQSGSIPISRRLSSYLWVWGQFVDHDIDLTEAAVPAESAPIPIPAGDPMFDPFNTGTATMQFSRSEFSLSSGTGTDNPREQMNIITGWIDASMVYGSDATRAAALRMNDGSGKLKTSDGDLLPWNTPGLANAGGSGPNLFLAGDVRANENVALSAMHTLFVREHNRVVDRLRDAKPWLDGETLYQRARHIVAAEIQMITYHEFLPALLGWGEVPLNSLDYDPTYNATIRNEFSTAAFRLGHSLLNEQLPRVDVNGQTIPAGNLTLAGAFFAPHELSAHGLDSLLRGLATQRSENIDVYVTDAVRNFLFGPPPAGFDLASLNIQRGRDHGLPAYNEARVTMGFAPMNSFAEITKDPIVQMRLAAAYSSPDEIDLWVGGLAEDHKIGRGGVLGELFSHVVATQFIALAKADQYFYQRSLTWLDWKIIGDPSLSAIIRRNTGIGSELPDDVFRVPL